MSFTPEEILVYYKVLRIGLLAAALYGIIIYLYTSQRGKTIEANAARIFEEHDG